MEHSSPSYYSSKQRYPNRCTGVGAWKKCLLWYASLWLFHGNSWWLPELPSLQPFSVPAMPPIGHTQPEARWAGPWEIPPLCGTEMIKGRAKNGSRHGVGEWKKAQIHQSLLQHCSAWHKIGCSMKNKLFWKCPWQDSVPGFQLKITFLSRPTEKQCIIMWSWGGDDKIAFIEYLICYRHSFKFFTLIIWTSEQSYEIGTNISNLPVKKKIEAKKGDPRLHC